MTFIFQFLTPTYFDNSAKMTNLACFPWQLFLQFFSVFSIEVGDESPRIGSSVLRGHGLEFRPPRKYRGIHQLLSQHPQRYRQWRSRYRRNDLKSASEAKSYWNATSSDLQWDGLEFLDGFLFSGFTHAARPLALRGVERDRQRWVKSSWEFPLNKNQPPKMKKRRIKALLRAAVCSLSLLEF